MALTARRWAPVCLLLLLVGGFFSPLFHLSQVHGVSGPMPYLQHFYFEALAGLGGYWASGFCKHPRHRIAVMLVIDALTTLALVTLVG